MTDPDIAAVREGLALMSSVIACGETDSSLTVGKRQDSFAALARLEARLAETEARLESLRESAEFMVNIGHDSMDGISAENLAHRVLRALAGKDAG